MNRPIKSEDSKLPVNVNYTGDFTSNKEYYDILMEKFKSSDIVTPGSVLSFRSEGVHLINRFNLDDRKVLSYKTISSTKTGISIMGRWEDKTGVIFIQSPVSGEVVVKIMG